MTIISRQKIYQKGTCNSAVYDFSVPFDDNISERALRKAENRQKMAEDFRKESRHEMYCSSMTIIEALKKQDMDMIENIKKLFMGTPAIF